MLGKVTFVGTNNPRQGFLHGGDIPCLRPHEHRFRHASGDIVHLQFFIERIEKGIGNRLDGIHAFQELHKVFVAIGKQKFCEGHRVNLQEVDLAHRERGWFCQGNAQQRTGAGDMILRSVLAEILHGVDNLRAVLHLVKNDKCLFRDNLLPTGQHQILQDAVNILGGFKELFIFFVFVKVKIGSIFIITSAEFFENPCLAHLTHTL